ncbi:TatD-related deoxyribonuclease [Salinarchaeum sp. Harcht-Bsk1]|uniref:TatD family hydrolase n=1 Tax=Salinarchaeum sp. Harcht-Bsk1 TaxID=1333523 RepID=UPI00034248A9|nr:TatD family hydrolase [Salinarchaeum sp. Harcht-Bsk1]AGN01098.1 TatD-related deoxyribonuclease [Salinarchaeum sp. Harcht-Bsk1]
MPEYDGAILDDHLHLSPERGRGVDAVETFAEAGGTHMLVVNLPSWHYGVEIEAPEDFRVGFESTIGVVEDASEVLSGRAWPVLGVHPGLLSRLVDDRDFEPEEARDLLQAGIDVAADYVADGPALALKSGRPHYDVPDPVWAASNAVMRHAFETAAELGCAVQLHAEAGEDFSQVAEWAEDAGLPRGRVVKHYAEGRLEGPVPSVICQKDRLETAAERAETEDEPFLMETDFLDDPDRPGAVMGPKTVPRRVEWLLEQGHADAIRTAHVDTPAAVYGIDTEATLE